jgi:formylglycine-generating enzyme required for sulfatase activity/energy-coupling factor transporter ATP-binding protein EcfA2
VTTAPVEFAAPYPGLRPFLPAEAPLFYGRGTHIADLIKILRAEHFLAVVGSSGCGKSSLVRAGLLPAVEQGYLGGPNTEWRFVIMRPGGSPYANLARELVQTVSEDGDADAETVAFRQATLRTGPRGLLDAVSDCLLPESAQILVLVDQFEEIFRYRPGFSNQPPHDAESDPQQLHNEALGFVDLLLSTARLGDSRVYVVLTMRSDFLGDCDAFRDLPEQISRAQFLTPRLTREELRDAIERPAGYEQFGGQIDRTVTAELINAMGERQDQLPLIQHALLRMWDFASENREAEAPVHITPDHLRRCAGVAQALNRHAEEVHALLDGRQQQIAEHLFCSLCQHSGEGRLVRRLTTVGEVAEIADATVEEVIAVTRELMQTGRNFLIASPSGSDAPADTLDATTMLDISHESLIRHWERLQNWVQQEEESATRFRRLVESARLHAGGEGELLRGRELAITQQWYDERKPTAAWGERYASGAFNSVEDFLRASRRRRIKVTVAVVAAVAFVVFVASFLFWNKQKQQAETGVRVVMYAPPESVPDAVRDLRRYRDRAAPKLKATFDDQSTASRGRLRAAVALAELAKLDKPTRDFLLQSVSLSPKVLDGECVNIVRALGSVDDSVTDELLRRTEEEESVEVKVRYATVSLHLGDARLARQLLTLGSDPTGRTAFINGYPRWRGELSQVLGPLRANEDRAFRSGLAAAVGGIPIQDPSADRRQELFDVLAELYRDALDGRTHSAAGWALRQWEQDPPSIEPTRSAPTNCGWFVNRHGMTMLKVTAGSFTMGDADGDDDEKPHRVTLTQDLFVCDREVTVKQFDDFVQDKKDLDDHYPGKTEELWEEYYEPVSPTDDCPVHNVSWFGTVVFCNWLSEKEDRQPCYTITKEKGDENAAATVECDFEQDGYRLPTEAEWEYACRAQSQTAFAFGDDEKFLTDYAYFAANSASRAWPGGKKTPNAWGLFDMHGNMWEWCWDWYGPYGPVDVDDPKGPSSGSKRVMRGGGWYNGASNCRSALRNRFTPGSRYDDVGFRVVCGG